VRSRQDLFFLPNLSRMEVKTKVNETAMRLVEPGMQARVRVEALPNFTIEGEVVSVSPLPIMPTRRFSSDQVKDYLTRVELRSVPEGLMPGMTAQVEIETASRPGALVVPTTSVAVDDGKAYCYVARGDRVERRDVTLGDAQEDLLEVVAGLDEGEQVVADPGVVSGSGVEVVSSPSASAVLGGQLPVGL
jgi:HlyD family secretion protein